MLSTLALAYIARPDRRQRPGSYHYGKLWQLSKHMLQRIFFAPPSKLHKNPAECKHVVECMQKRLSDEKSPNHLANWGPDIEGEFGGCAACLETVTERKHAERCEL